MVAPDAKAALGAAYNGVAADREGGAERLDGADLPVGLGVDTHKVLAGIAIGDDEGAARTAAAACLVVGEVARVQVDAVGLGRGSGGLERGAAAGADAVEAVAAARVVDAKSHECLTLVARQGEGRAARAAPLRQVAAGVLRDLRGVGLQDGIDAGEGGRVDHGAGPVAEAVDDGRPVAAVVVARAAGADPVRQGGRSTHGDRGSAHCVGGTDGRSAIDKAAGAQVDADQGRAGRAVVAVDGTGVGAVRDRLRGDAAEREAVGVGVGRGVGGRRDGGAAKADPVEGSAAGWALREEAYRHLTFGAPGLGVGAARAVATQGAVGVERKPKRGPAVVLGCPLAEALAELSGAAHIIPLVLGRRAAAIELHAHARVVGLTGVPVGVAEAAVALRGGGAAEGVEGQTTVARPAPLPVVSSLHLDAADVAAAEGTGRCVGGGIVCKPGVLGLAVDAGEIHARLGLALAAVDGLGAGARRGAGDAAEHVTAVAGAVELTGAACGAGAGRIARGAREVVDAVADFARAGADVLGVVVRLGRVGGEVHRSGAGLARRCIARAGGAEAIVVVVDIAGVGAVAVLVDVVSRAVGGAGVDGGVGACAVAGNLCSVGRERAGRGEAVRGGRARGVVVVVVGVCVAGEVAVAVLIDGRGVNAGPGEGRGGSAHLLGGGGVDGCVGIAAVEAAGRRRAHAVGAAARDRGGDAGGAGRRAHRDRGRGAVAVVVCIGPAEPAVVAVLVDVVAVGLGRSGVDDIAAVIAVEGGVASLLGAAAHLARRRVCRAGLRAVRGLRGGAVAVVVGVGVAEVGAVAVLVGIVDAGGEGLCRAGVDAGRSDAVHDAGVHAVVAGE